MVLINLTALVCGRNHASRRVGWGFAFPSIGGNERTDRLAGRLFPLHFRSADWAKVTLHAVASLVIAGPLNWISTSRAADLPSGDGYAYVAPVAQTGWEFRVTPYAWAPASMATSPFAVKRPTSICRFGIYSTPATLVRS